MVKAHSEWRDREHAVIPKRLHHHRELADVENGRLLHVLFFKFLDPERNGLPDLIEAHDERNNEPEHCELPVTQEQKKCPNHARGREDGVDGEPLYNAEGGDYPDGVIEREIGGKVLHQKDAQADPKQAERIGETRDPGNSLRGAGVDDQDQDGEKCEFFTKDRRQSKVRGDRGDIEKNDRHKVMPDRELALRD